MGRDPSGLSNDEMTREIYRRIVGDGTETNPGLDKRVDRLETGYTIMKWLSGTALGAALVSIVDFVMAKFRGH